MTCEKDLREWPELAFWQAKVVALGRLEPLPFIDWGRYVIYYDTIGSDIFGERHYITEKVLMKRYTAGVTVSVMEYYIMLTHLPTDREVVYIYIEPLTATELMLGVK